MEEKEKKKKSLTLPKKFKHKKQQSPFLPLQQLPPATTSSSSSSRSHLYPKPISLSTIPDYKSKPTPNPSRRPRSNNSSSKENHFPTAAPSSGMLRKHPHHPSFPSKPVQRFIKLSAHSSISMNKSSSGSQGFRVNPKKMGSGKLFMLPDRLNPDDNLNCSNTCTPVGKFVCDSGIHSANLDDDKDVESDSKSDASAKVTITPPIEASVSPEIQCGAGASGGGVGVSTATPVCYGAGHVLSGVRDKRKCRPRGILTVGSEMSSLGGGGGGGCDNERNVDEVLAKSRPSFVPLPAEASVKWLSSSPQGDVGRGYIGASSLTLISCQDLSGFGSDISNNGNSIHGNDDGKSTGNTRSLLVSPKRDPSFRCFLGISAETMDGVSTSASPHVLESEEAGCFWIQDTPGNKTSFSTCSMSSGGNLAQSPISDVSSDKHVALCCTDEDAHQRKEFDFELHHVAGNLGKARLSPRSRMLSGDHPDYPSVILTQSHNEVNTCASWISDSTLAGVSLSDMSMSWREGLLSQTFDRDELDCCRCLSDEEKDCDESDLFQTSSPGAFESIVIKKQNLLGSSGLRSPKILKQEPSSVGKGKETPFRALPNVSAESIFIDGGNLGASGDSDWTLSYNSQTFDM